MIDMAERFSRSACAYIKTTLVMGCLGAILGCDPSDCLVEGCKELRTKNCERAGATGAALKACRDTEQGYNRLMEPIWANQDREEIAEFNAALRSLPARTIPEAQYQTISLKELDNELEKLEMIEDSKWSKHPLFRKRFRVEGEIEFHPTNFESKLAEHITLGMTEVLNGSTDFWQIEANAESLSKQERAFIKNQCISILEFCRSEVFGVIGVPTRDQVASPGLQIEYMKISPREPKK